MSAALALAHSPDRESRRIQHVFSNRDKLEGECLLPFFGVLGGGSCSIRISQLLFFLKGHYNFSYWMSGVFHTFSEHFHNPPFLPVRTQQMARGCQQNLI